jgi:hypothetical protein
MLRVIILFFYLSSLPNKLPKIANTPPNKHPAINGPGAKGLGNFDPQPIITIKKPNTKPNREPVFLFISLY